MKNFVLSRNDYEKENRVFYGNMFLIGNGHLGYRGTLEEYKKDDLVGLNVVGFYDRYKKKWRESINVPNPFYIKVKNYNVLENEPLNHSINLKIDEGVFFRVTEYKDLIIKSKRIIHQDIDNLLMEEFQIIGKKDINFEVELGLDLDIYEINGPHFKKKNLDSENNYLRFIGQTNENKKIACFYKAFCNNKNIKFSENIKVLQGFCSKNEVFSIKIYYKISESKFEEDELNFAKYNEENFDVLFNESTKTFKEKFNKCRVLIGGDEVAQDAIDYSLYHLIILGNKNYKTSIPARGVSGQTYKGAIFWDTEIFMFPFYILVEPKIAKNLLLYRIDGLRGAKRKARSLGFKGAFYAWEGQERGREACSKYNVSDPVTNKPIRTYFSEKQIHITFDIIKTFDEYYKVTHDDEFMVELGGFKVIEEGIKFLISRVKYSKIDEKYHLLDVIGPDEYHERVDDNAFTNYMAHHSLKIYLKFVNLYKIGNKKIVNEAQKLQENLYLPKPNNDGIIEQFRGYFDLEDVSVDEVKNRVKNSKEYLGGANGVASKTRVIKQADVVALIALLPDLFSDEIAKANYDFYIKYTEHGSSLSSSMHSLVASRIKYYDDAYKMFINSATIDLSKNQKMFAGGIYIGGTHPASNGGAYLSLVYGMCGLNYFNKKYEFSRHFDDKIGKISFNFYENNVLKNAIIDENKILIKEANL